MNNNTNNNNILDRLIKVLAAMLLVFLLALTGVKIYKSFFYDSSPSSSVIDHNTIGTPDESDKDEDGNETEDSNDSSSDPSNGGSGTSASEGQQVGGNDSNSTAVNFYEMHYRYNERFSIDNMFPGDSVTKKYGITVNHIGPIDVTFHVDVEEDSQILADALHVRLLYNDSVIHEGSMKNFSFTSRITSNVEKRDYLDYRVEVYLPTDTDNMYQALKCNADFYWSADEVILENGESGKLIPDSASSTESSSQSNILSGDIFNIDIFVCLLLLSMVILFNLWIWRKKDDKQKD